MTPAQLRAWREEWGISQAAAYCWYIGLTVAPKKRLRNMARSWRRWESGERPIPPPLAARVAEVRLGARSGERH